MTIPDVPQPYSQRVLPAVYGDELSYYEVISKLIEKLNELIGFINQIQNYYATIEMLTNSQNEQDIRWGESLTASIKMLNDKIDSEVIKLEEAIKDATTGKVLSFDPTYGIAPRPVEDVIRNVYHWLRYLADYAMTIDNKDLTAETRDGYNVTAREFDLYSSKFYSGGDFPTPTPEGDYVEKYNILANYFEGN